MTERKPFRQSADQILEQVRVLTAGENFSIPVVSRLNAVALVAGNEAKLDLKNRRLVVSFDLSDSIKGVEE